MAVGAIVGAAAVGVASSVGKAKAQEKAAKKAQRTQAEALNRQIDLQEKQLEEAKPFKEAGFSTLEDLRAELQKRFMSGDVYGRAQLADEFRQTNNALAATGNLRSGLAQDVTQRAVERATDRNLLYQQQVGRDYANVASLYLGQGQAATNAGLALQPGINQGYENISNLQLAKGGIQSGLYGSIGNTLGGALMMGSSALGGNFGSLFGGGK